MRYGLTVRWRTLPAAHFEFANKESALRAIQLLLGQKYPPEFTLDTYSIE